MFAHKQITTVVHVCCLTKVHNITKYTCTHLLYQRYIVQMHVSTRLTLFCQTAIVNSSIPGSATCNCWPNIPPRSMPKLPVRAKLISTAGYSSDGISPNSRARHCLIHTNPNPIKDVAFSWHAVVRICTYPLHLLYRQVEHWYAVVLHQCMDSSRLWSIASGPRMLPCPAQTGTYRWAVHVYTVSMSPF